MWTSPFYSQPQWRSQAFEVIKLFSCSTQLSMKFSLLINMKMPTIVGIFIFISREIFMLSYVQQRGWLGEAKVSCILSHRGFQLILAYSWARPAILVAGKGRGGMFLFLLFLHFYSCSFFLPCPSLSSPLLSLFYLSLGDDTKWPTRVDVSLNPNTINMFSKKEFGIVCNLRFISMKNFMLSSVEHEKVL